MTPSNPSVAENHRCGRLKWPAPRLCRQAWLSKHVCPGMIRHPGGILMNSQSSAEAGVCQHGQVCRSQHSTRRCLFLQSGIRYSKLGQGCMPSLLPANHQLPRTTKMLISDRLDLRNPSSLFWSWLQIGTWERDERTGHQAAAPARSHCREDCHPSKHLHASFLSSQFMPCCRVQLETCQTQCRSIRPSIIAGGSAGHDTLIVSSWMY